MKTHSPLLMVLALLVSVAIVIPPDVSSQAGQKAGEVSRVIPDVEIARGPQQLAAPVKTLVDWGDVVHTGDGGRARVSLDDGSLLNVGSSSSLTVTQHNAAAQQTQIDLEYGRVRAQVVKQTKPNAKFEVHTAVGTAGVVGGDSGITFLNGILQGVVYEGQLILCNLDGACVTLIAGQFGTIRNGHQPPDQPTQATSSEVTDTANATSVGNTIAEIPVAHLSPWWVIGIAVLVAIPAIVIPIATHGKTGSPGTVGCVSQLVSACSAP